MFPWFSFYYLFNCRCSCFDVVVLCLVSIISFMLISCLCIVIYICLNISRCTFCLYKLHCFLFAFVSCYVPLYMYIYISQAHVYFYVVGWCSSVCFSCSFTGMFVCTLFYIFCFCRFSISFVLLMFTQCFCVFVLCFSVVCFDCLFAWCLIFLAVYKLSKFR